MHHILPRWRNCSDRAPVSRKSTPRIVLAAPISWTHHMVWVVPLLGILVGAGRTWWRWLLVLAVVAVLSPPAMAWLNDDLGVHRDPSVLDRLRFDLPILLMVAAVLLVPDRGRSAATPVAGALGAAVARLSRPIPAGAGSRGVGLRPGLGGGGGAG